MMANVQLRFDANTVKSELNKVLKNKVKSLQEDEGLYIEMLETYYDKYLQPYLYAAGFDTGAFAESGSGYPSHTYEQRYKYYTKSEGWKESTRLAGSNYFRQGYQTISSHHGIERDAIEYRKNGPHSYFRPVLGRIFSLPEGYTGRDVYNALPESSTEAFKEEVKRMIIRKANKK